MHNQHSIRFLLGDERRELSDQSPTMTVLEYLRTIERMTGTKEGCAEGDCGACTVVIAQDVNHKLQYRAGNSCIMFLPFLHGKQLLTVEHLQEKNGALHPVQQAMVEQHGAQCGFCTPGFMMSMFALYHDDCGTDRQTIDDGLAGNLCRCTGYAPIVRAVRQAMTEPRADQFDTQEERTRNALSELEVTSSLRLKSGTQDYFAPVTVTELAQILQAKPASHIVAGATDVGLWVTKQRRHLESVISISNIRAMQGITVAQNVIKIGAATTIADAMPRLSEYYPSLHELFRRYGSVQVRNLATLGGNVVNGSPIGDSLPALITLNARLIISCTGGSRILPIEDFFIDYGRQDLRTGEFLERIELPLPLPNQDFRVYKISKRFHQDISAVCGAFSMTMDDGIVQSVRIAFGGMAATPKRARFCEQTLIGSSLSGAVIDRAKCALKEDFTPLTDCRGAAEYRSLVAANLLDRLAQDLQRRNSVSVWKTCNA